MSPGGIDHEELFAHRRVLSTPPGSRSPRGYGSEFQHGARPKVPAQRVENVELLDNHDELQDNDYDEGEYFSADESTHSAFSRPRGVVRTPPRGTGRARGQTRPAPRRYREGSSGDRRRPIDDTRGQKRSFDEYEGQSDYGDRYGESYSRDRSDNDYYEDVYYGRSGGRGYDRGYDDNYYQDYGQDYDQEYGYDYTGDYEDDEEYYSDGYEDYEENAQNDRQDDRFVYKKGASNDESQDDIYDRLHDRILRSRGKGFNDNPPLAKRQPITSTPQQKVPVGEPSVSQIVVDKPVVDKPGAKSVDKTVDPLDSTRKSTDVTSDLETSRQKVLKLASERFDQEKERSDDLDPEYADMIDVAIRQVEYIVM